MNDSERWGPVGTFDACDWLDAKQWSAHALIAPNGTIIELVSPELVAFHAGKSEFAPWTWLNANFLGAEFLVAGAHDYGSWLEAIQEPDCYTPAQYEAGAWLFATWAKKYGFDVTRIRGHQDVAGDDVRGEGNGKQDPGGGFDWARFQAAFDDWSVALA